MTKHLALQLVAACSNEQNGDDCRHCKLLTACACSMCRLEDLGYGVGHRLLEILYFRERGSKRDVRLLDILRFIHSTLWRYLFGRQARDLEQSNTVCLATGISGLNRRASWRMQSTLR